MSFVKMLVKNDASSASITLDCTLKEVAEILAENERGVLAIADRRGDIVGLVSERDIVHAIGNHGASALDDNVSHHMSWRCPKADVTDCIALTTDLFD
jgi:predicted transcriptional regulator